MERPKITQIKDRDFDWYKYAIDLEDYADDLEGKLRTQQPPENNKTKKFEYKLEADFEDHIPTDWLNRIGKDGWELVAVVDYGEMEGRKLLRFYLKRRI